ncbi:MAG: UDP-glucose 4-epimerase [Candidatus Woesebacteria bacterium GW2011_GWA2_40_7]|uniref:UDP-glucose 4-epimerase n=3 Tax=Candidatus Woeseibacteriota TaxID=1752722 RepID=A0A0G0PR78_9BACT|nr:MAG: UDP-glucose 4-epimerase [Candidatus Woesebacteria bacterium GW2011_GWB1_39_10]KKR73868.1 MAG: UDP-glucose 4-epimerase [Candidatus Woesebacteria bacterium GW2011_GWA2_40_7]KKS90876.1 MAG: UDP-glucose 4-epimerase [Candidatus Woesebacteria bacterium GW2011_GWA1_43_12]
MKKILVTGGAGYIGSFMVRQLRLTGCDPVVLDNLSQGHKESVKDFRLEKIDLVTQKEKLDALFSQEKFDGVIHMASFIQMGESFKDPAKYYRNNVSGFINLLDSMKNNKVTNIILSSTAGIYGNPIRVPIMEEDIKNPLNAYGDSKYMMERMLEDYDSAYGIKFISLRYFNAAGAALDGSIGEDHPEESHLIPNLIKSVLENTEFTLFGDNYETPDGTCIRDYIHVLDLTEAHSLAIQAIIDGKPSGFYNMGIGKGYSNREVVSKVEEVTGSKIQIRIAPRREGDAAALYADNGKIKKELNWEPRYDLQKIVESAYLWHKNHPRGYNSDR